MVRFSILCYTSVCQNVLLCSSESSKITWEIRDILGHLSQSVCNTDNKVFGEAEVCFSYAFWTVNHKHQVQGRAYLLTVLTKKEYIKLVSCLLTSNIKKPLDVDITTATTCLSHNTHDVTFLYKRSNERGNGVKPWYGCSLLPICKISNTNLIVAYSKTS